MNTTVLFDVTKTAPTKDGEVDLTNEFLMVCEQYAKSKLALKVLQDKVKKDKAKLDELGEVVHEWADTTLLPEQAITVASGKYELHVSACIREAQEIDLQAVIDTIGLSTFLSIASVKIEDLKKYLTGQQFEKLVPYAYTGSRRLSADKL